MLHSAEMRLEEFGASDVRTRELIRAVPNSCHVPPEEKRAPWGL
jgi:hypothetical protein